MAENYVSNEYPYGEFPLQYTKLGQEQLKKQWQNNNLNVKPDKPDTPPKPDQHPHKEGNKNFDMHKLLPLIKKMNSNKTLSQADLMQMLMGFMDNENKELAEVFNVIASTQTVKEKDITTLNISSNAPSIDSFRKIT